jgi:hypothetical protein
MKLVFRLGLFLLSCGEKGAQRLGIRKRTYRLNLNSLFRMASMEVLLYKCN